MEPISWNEGHYIFREAHAMAADVYRMTQPFPYSEGKGLVYEMRQSTLAISAFLSDALRKDQKSYLVDVLEAVHRHLDDLKRNLRVSLSLMYLSAEAHAKLDDQAQRLQDQIRQWQEKMSGLAVELVA